MTRPPLDLEAIRQRAEAATPGPWELIGGDEFVTGADVLVAPDDGGVTTENATFIAHAREDVPALLAEVERLRDGIAAIHYPVEVEPSETICAGCSTRRGSGDNVRFFPYVEWPCETATLHDEATS